MGTDSGGLRDNIQCDDLTIPYIHTDQIILDRKDSNQSIYRSTARCTMYIVQCPFISVTREEQNKE